MTNQELNDQGLPHGTRLRADEISPREFAQRFNANPTSVKLIDVRTLTEWNTARVAGSIHAPIESIEQNPEDLDVEGASLIGFICHHGVRSLRAVLALQSLGYENTRSIIGGIELWSQAVDANIPRYTRDRITGKCTTR